MVLPIYASLEKLDWRLVEAAFDLGADRWRALRRIIVPLSLPGIVGGAMLVFVPSLGAFVTPVLLGGGKSLMIGNLMQMQFGASRNWPFGAALAFVLLASCCGAMMLLPAALRRGRRPRSDEAAETPLRRFPGTGVVGAWPSSPISTCRSWCWSLLSFNANRSAHDLDRLHACDWYGEVFVNKTIIAAAKNSLIVAHDRDARRRPRSRPWRRSAPARGASAARRRSSR